MIALLPLLLLAASSPRQVVNLDTGWKFLRIPSPPTIWNGPDAVPTSTWHVLKVSSEERDGEDGRATNAFDGNPNSIWHTEWKKAQPPYPHELVIDLGSRVETEGLRLLTRQTSPHNGRPNHFQLYLSNDPSTWGNPVVNDTVPDSIHLYEKRFAPRSAHFMRLVFLDGHKPEPFLSLSEIGLIRRVSTSDHKDWNSQYNIARISTGGDQFDWSPEKLELAKTLELKGSAATLWESVSLPHTAWIRPMGTNEIWQGVAYYLRIFTRPKAAVGKLVTLTIEGAMQSSDLWLNGHHVGARRGGYLPLVADLSPYLKDKNELLVRLDNRDNPIIPPGKPQKELDFMYGSGLYRNAYLTITNPIRVTDPILENTAKSGGVIVTFPDVNAKQATVRVRTHIRNSTADSSDLQLVQTLIDEQGHNIATSITHTSLGANSATQSIANFIVRSPKLWFPDTPHLYHLRTVVRKGSVQLDEVSTRFGIRKIEVSRKLGFVLNGRPIHLVGTNRHQDYPWVGPALSDAAHVRDVKLLRLAGHNIVRLSHYPQSPAFLDACDEQGLMVIPCIPGWQFLNDDPRFNRRVDQDIRDLIRRDRNHPCTAFWEASLNETYPPAETSQHWNRVAKSESVDGSILTAGDANEGAPWDIAYNQWREDLSRPQDALPDKPGYIREYGDYEFGGDTSSSRVRIRQGIDALLQEAWNHVWSLNKFRPQYPWTLGEGTWEMFDTNVPWQYQISACGLADIFRRPKPTFWFFASQEAKQPILKIASTWQPGTSKRTVVVFTNCDHARLTVNHHFIAVGKPIRGASTPYDKAKPFDGSNTANLKHPPIIFRNVPFSAGVLEVAGTIDGKPAAHDKVNTAGKAAALRVWVDDLGVPLAENDLVFVRAAIVDAQGNICPGESRRIDFTVRGGSHFAGESFANAEMGIASVLIRTATTKGPLLVSAKSLGGLRGGCNIR